MTDTFTRNDMEDNSDLNRDTDFTRDDKENLNRQMNDYNRDPNDSKNLNEKQDDENMMDKVNDKVDEFKQRMKNDNDN